MILVDSSVWIDLFKNKHTAQVSFLENIQKTLSHEICISHIIYFEVLRGIASELERKRVERLFENLIFRDYHNENFNTTISIYRLCQQRGFTLSRLGDWLILKTVLDHSLEFLTTDNDFYKLHSVYPFRLIQ